jgi:carbonic anhydrase/acetyltransferase-like protein (isoleucine patch superfamily)
MNITIIGSGSHAGVLRESLELQFEGAVFRMVGKTGSNLIGNADRVIVGIGTGRDCGIPVDRRAAFDRYADDHFITSVHPSAVVSPSAGIGRGGDIQALAYVGPGARIGENVLVNTGARVHHDCIIGPHCVIAPGAEILGGVTLGHSCTVGAGAIIVQGVELANETRIPAGTLVCGQDDFRKPVRMVRSSGADTLAVSAVEIDPVDGEFVLFHEPLDLGPDPDVQQG